MFISYLSALALVLTSANGVYALIGRADQQVISYFQRKTGLTSGDGGFTVPLNDGRTLWLLSDSHVDDMGGSTDGTQPCLFNTRNAIVLQPINDWNQNDAKTLVGPNTHFESLFKADNDTANWYWPGHGVQLADGTVYAYCAEITTQGTGNLGIKNTGNDHWCKFNPKSLSVTGYAKLPDFNGIDFGAGFVQGDTQDGYMYAFGQKLNGQIFGRSLFAARFSVANPTSWQFWDGYIWNNDVKKAQKLLDDFGNTMSVNKVSGKYLVLSTEPSLACNQGKTIYARVSDHVTGPYTTKQAIHTIEESLINKNYPFFYMAISHPELTNSNNELLITYSINGYQPCLEECPNNRLNPDYYRMKGVRVNINQLFSLCVYGL